jgi:regulatory protein
MAGIITRLVYQKRNKNRVSIFLDDAYAFSLPDVLASSLQLGQHLDDEEIACLRAQDDRQRAMDKALRLLARRPRSSHEIDDALKQSDISTDIREQVIARLEEMDYLDDREFARWWVENRTEFNPRSIRALQQELYQKGISSSIITEALALLDDDTLAVAAGRQRAYRWQHLPRAEFDKKMLGFLQRRGFSYPAARFATDFLREQLRQSNDTEQDRLSD